MSDPLCAPYVCKNGTRVSGAAAREARIADAGGTAELFQQSLMVGLATGIEAAMSNLIAKLANEKPGGKHKVIVPPPKGKRSDRSHRLN